MKTYTIEDHKEELDKKLGSLYSVDTSWLAVNYETRPYVIRKGSILMLVDYSIKEELEYYDGGTGYVYYIKAFMMHENRLVNIEFSIEYNRKLCDEVFQDFGLVKQQ